LAEDIDGKRLNSPNDLAVQADGTIWFTDPPWGLAKQTEGKELSGHWVFRRDPDGTLTVVLRDCAMPNGIALSPDESTLYIADTGGHRSDPMADFRDRPATVSAWAIGDDLQLSTDPLWSVDTRCDGMCVDELGFIYTTAQAGIVILSPAGEIVATIEVPEQPVNVCFGGAEGRTLFITARTSLLREGCVEIDLVRYLPAARRGDEESRASHATRAGEIGPTSGHDSRPTIICAEHARLVF
jgi:gluconolactonase